MKQLHAILSRRGPWPLGLLVLGALVLLPGLGSYGFWEPQEIRVAERALEELDQAEVSGEVGDDGVTPAARKPGVREGFPLTDWLVTRGIEAGEVSELGARLPLALLGLALLLATYLLAVRLRGPRVGVLAALVLLSCPLFLFQARQLTSDLGATLGATLIVLGLIDLIWPARARTGWLAGRELALVALDAVLVTFGAALAYNGGGALLGVAVPFGAVGLAALASGVGDLLRRDDASAPRWSVWLGGAAALAIAIGALAYLCHEVFTIVDAGEGDRSLAGKTLQPTRDHVEALGGVWKPKGDPKVGFDGMFVHIAFGVFPWVALAPLALARLATGRRGDSRGTFAGYVLFAWAAAAWVAASVFQRKVGPLLYPALPAIAVGVALWIDELWTAARDPDRDAPIAAPLLALFALAAAVVVGKDLYNFPERFLSLHLETPVRDFPEGVKLHVLVAALGIACGAALAAFLATAGRRRPERLDTVGDVTRRVAAEVGRWSLPLALALAVAFAAVLAHVWTPRLSTKLSSKDVFAVYHELREDGDLLGLQGRAGAGPRFYAGGDFEVLKGRTALVSFLQRKERVFALARASELCALHKEASKAGFDYYVIDDSNAELILLSNALWHGGGEPPRSVRRAVRSVLDDNPLSRTMLRERPEHIQRPLDANFDDKVRLIGVDMPSSVPRGSTFEVTLYFEVLKPVGRNWKVFVHFDGGGMRFQGDHDPVGGRCGTSYWQPGDFIVDRFTVEAGSVSHPRTQYQVWAGLFVGSSGNWENMKALSGNADDTDRVPIGSVRVE